MGLQDQYNDEEEPIFSEESKDENPLPNRKRLLNARLLPFPVRRSLIFPL